MKVTVDIPDGFLESYLVIHPNSEREANPDHVDEETTPDEPTEVAKYTDVEWLEESLRQYAERQIARGEEVAFKRGWEPTGDKGVSVSASA